MNPSRLSIALLLLLTALTSCDEGDIIEGEVSAPSAGRTAVLTADISGTTTWSSQYNLVLAGFAEGSDNVVVQKLLPDTDGPVTLELQLTSDDIATIQLCVTNRLRQRVATFASVDVTAAATDTLRLDAGHVDADMFGTIQRLVFTPTCARCHGLGSTPAANLTLAEGLSYDQLVRHPASQPERATRVMPGDAEASLLHKVLRGDADAGVHFDHNNMVKETNILTLIDNWINALQ